ncbi:MAG: hypothetical protein KF703_01335, partial [Actinobacteria bacterium]|nr:hypothetical protein [Actinomycetota bacterium]
EAPSRMRAPSGEFATWLRTAWWEIVGSGSKAHHGRGVDLAVWFWTDRAEESADRVRVAEYLWRESGKWAQKQPPEGFGSLKFYGRWGGAIGFKPIVSEAQMEEQAGYELRRVLRRMQEGKQREAAERMGRPYRKGQTSRGRDGLTVFDVANGSLWAPRLLAWAEDVALYKAMTAVERPPLEYRRGRPIWRAFSELEALTQAAQDEIAYDEWVASGGEEGVYERWLEAEAAREASAEYW